MKLRPRVPKAYGTGAHREVPIETTYERVLPHARRVGITRIADITGLDRIGIPVYNAICPRSNDLISVYNGKGGTPLAAKTSAIMEAVERFAAALPLTPVAVASYSELEAAGRAALDPRTVNLELFEHYRLDMPISWVQGFDLMNERSVLVPMYLAGYYMQFHEIPCYPLGTTNGIASGNSLEEAICHALCELIERDEWTIADVVSNRLQRIMGQGALGTAGSVVAAAWLHERHPNIDLDSLTGPAAQYVEMFRAAGLSVQLKNVTSAMGVATVLAVVAEDVSSTFSQSHLGLGCHPDADVAVCRALTEVAQSRVVDINALREDIALPDAKVEKWFFHVKRSGQVNKNAWAFKPSTRSIPMRDIPSVVSEDIVADTDFMLSRLRASGLHSAVVVDLSPPDVPAKVVRVIVPGIESWIIDRSKLGQRATAEWNSALNTLGRACELASATRQEMP